MPPASPEPGWCSGEVCTESMATRRGLRCSLSRGEAAGERRPSLLTYWLTWRSSLLRTCRSEDTRLPPRDCNSEWCGSISRSRGFTQSLLGVDQPFDSVPAWAAYEYPVPLTLVHMTTRAATRPVGTVTRGTTNPNRLRRMARGIAATHGAELRRAA